MSTLDRIVEWPQLDVELDPEAPTAFGLIVLGTDRVSAGDIPSFWPDDVADFTARLPMDTAVTPETLEALGDHTEAAARLLVAGGPLHGIGFACTSGTVAVGVERMEAAVRRGRPGVPICNPVDGGVKALGALGARRIALLTPYLDAPSAMVEAYFAAQGIEIVDHASFKLAGDPEMNRVSANSLIEAGSFLGAHPDADALFISCTGMRTRHVIEPLEAALGKPVVTSNQALAWDLLRTAGRTDVLEGRGRLFRVA